MSTLPRDPDSGARLRVLILEDNPDDAELVLRELRRGGFEPVWERVETAEDFSAALTREWDVILTDFSMPHFNAFGALEILEGRQNAPPCIVVSGTIGEDTAVAAIKAGAADYLMKDRLARLAATIRRELRDQAVRRLHEAEQRKAHEAIRKLLAAIEQTVDSIVMTDPDGRINYVNTGFQKLYGYSREEVAGKTPRVLKSGQARRSVLPRVLGDADLRRGFPGRDRQPGERRTPRHRRNVRERDLRRFRKTNRVHRGPSRHHRKEASGRGAASERGAIARESSKPSRNASRRSIETARS